MKDDLNDYLRSLEQEDSYRVDAVLKEGELERTEKVYLVGEDNAEQGPFIRKFFAASDDDSALGGAYERIYQAQKDGRQFTHLPQITECYGVGERRCVVMEFVDGDTLADAVHKRSPSLALVREIFPQLCDAVRELHEDFAPPLIHRDLKPSNIVVTSDGVSIIDFGITRSFKEGADADTTRFGTRSYAPPEQFGFGQTDVRSDVYALGSLLYFCLTEQTPDAEVRNVEYRSDRVPEHLRQVIVKATAFDPDNRYADVAAFKEALLAALDDPGEPSTSVAAQRQDAGAVASGSAVSVSEKSRERNPIKRALAAIPIPVGIAWDIVLLFIFLFTEVAAVFAIANPSAANAAMTTAALAISYEAIVVGIIAPVLFFICDRRPLRRIIKPLARVSLLRQLIVCIIVLVIGVVLVLIFYRPM